MDNFDEVRADIKELLQRTASIDARMRHMESVPERVSTLERTVSVHGDRLDSERRWRVALGTGVLVALGKAAITYFKG